MSKLVRESVSFERGGDPRKTMKVGKLERLKQKYNEKDLDSTLVEASAAGNLDDVKFLIQRGADIRVVGRVSINRASAAGHLDVVKYLVESGASIDVKLDEALIIASENGHLDVVKYLAENTYVNIHAEDEYALESAAVQGHLDILKYLHEQGANLQHAAEYALPWAADFGHLDIIKYILEHGTYVSDNQIKRLLNPTLKKYSPQIYKYLKSKIKE